MNSLKKYESEQKDGQLSPKAASLTSSTRHQLRQIYGQRAFELNRHKYARQKSKSQSNKPKTRQLSLGKLNSVDNKIRDKSNNSKLSQKIPKRKNSISSSQSLQLMARKLNEQKQNNKSRYSQYSKRSRRSDWRPRSA